MNKKEEIKREKKRIIITIIIVLLIVFISIVIFCVLCKKYQTNEVANEENRNSIETLYQVQNQMEKLEKNTEKLGKTTDWELILVNQENKISDKYKVNLKEIEDNYKVDERILESLKDMLNDAREEGLKPIICSAYRTRKFQTDLYNKKVKEYKKQGYNQKKAEEKASAWVAIPGTGEHETGLSVDIVSKNYQLLDEEQEKTKEQKWLIENSYKYGFILRYPTEKKEITKINYEPWHYRYVGIENAKFIKEKNMCLEEYIEYLNTIEENSKEEV